MKVRHPRAWIEAFPDSLARELQWPLGGFRPGLTKSEPFRRRLKAYCNGVHLRVAADFEMSAKTSKAFRTSPRQCSRGASYAGDHALFYFINSPLD